MELNLKRTKKELCGFLKSEGIKVSMKMNKQTLLELFEKLSITNNTNGKTLEINEEVVLADNLLEENNYYEKQTQTIISHINEEVKPKYDMIKIEKYLKTQGLTLYDFSFKKEQQRIILRNRKY